MTTLADDLAIEARRRASAAKFMPPGRERDNELRLAALLDNAARRFAAREAVAGLEARAAVAA